MSISKRASRLGFTLVELAIVLAIAGVLFAGLWRLMAGGNQQSRDQSAAVQQLQLINSVKSYLGSSYGQSYMSVAGPAGTFKLYLPTTAAHAPDGSMTGTIANKACKDDITAQLAGAPAPYAGNTDAQYICDYLPLSFSGVTQNSYNQTYNIYGLKDSAGAGSPPQAYSFMIGTTGGDTIPDSSGGRIAAGIGGDGGFVYSTAVCPASAPDASYACGAYGTWYAKPTTYGLAASAGHIYSRSYMSSTQDATLPWLERNTTLQPDASRNFNTMSADFYMGTGFNMYLSPYDGVAYGTAAGGGSIFADGGSIYLGANAATVATIPTIGGGTIYLQGGTLADDPNLTPAGSTIFLHGYMKNPSGSTATMPNSTLHVVSNCNMASVSDTTCQYVANIAGDMSVEGLLNANSLYAATFIYQSGGASSDIRLKTNVQPIHSSWDDIMKLKPVSYNFKSTGLPSYGFIAQDVEKIYPDLVLNGADGMKAINYNGLIAPLVGAIQELKVENESLREQIKAQVLKQDMLEKKLQTHD